MPRQSSQFALYTGMVFRDKNFLVLDVSYGCSRNTDARGCPTDSPKCMLINLIVTPVEEENDYELLYDWAFGSQVYPATITFEEGQREIRKIDILDAECIAVQELFTGEFLSPFNRSESFVPDTEAYHAAHRRRQFFVETWGTNTSTHKLVLKAKSILVDHIEIKG